MGSLAYNLKERTNNMNENEQMEQNVAEKAEPKAEAKEPEKKYTDAEVDKIVQDRLAREQKKREKEVAEAEKLAKMNEKERYDYEVSELKKELDALKAEKNRSEMMTTARHMLANDGLNVSDELISVLVTADAEQTNEAVKNFSKLFKAEVDKAVKAQLAGGNPKKGSASALTKEDIMAIKDPNKRLRAIEENMDLFKKGN